MTSRPQAARAEAPAVRAASTSPKRQLVRDTAAKLLRSDDLIADERDVAALILRENPDFGNPRVVRCDWCRESRILFRDENETPFTLTDNGWACEPCDVGASSQEIKF